MISASNILLNSKKFSDPVTENQNSSLDSNHEHEQQAGDEQQQQQEQKKKKAKLGREKRLRRLKKMDEEAEKDDAEEDEAATSTTTRQLDASRFRFLNEQLYRQSSTASAALFREDPAAFRAYHRGYKLQVWIEAGGRKIFGKGVMTSKKNNNKFRSP